MSHVSLNNIHPDNIKMLSRVNSALGIEFSGIDFMIDDISVSYKINGGAINEVNARPSMYGHYITHKDTSVYEKILSLSLGVFI